MARPESIFSSQFKINSPPMLNPLQTEFLGGTTGGAQDDDGGSLHPL
jgi:hypothetical protein